MKSSMVMPRLWRALPRALPRAGGLFDGCLMARAFAKRVRCAPVAALRVNAINARCGPFLGLGGYGLGVDPLRASYPP